MEYKMSAINFQTILKDLPVGLKLKNFNETDALLEVKRIHQMDRKFTIQVKEKQTLILFSLFTEYTEEYESAFEQQKKIDLDLLSEYLKKGKLKNFENYRVLLEVDEILGIQDRKLTFDENRTLTLNELFQHYPVEYRAAYKKQCDLDTKTDHKAEIQRYREKEQLIHFTPQKIEECLKRSKINDNHEKPRSNLTVTESRESSLYELYLEDEIYYNAQLKEQNKVSRPQPGLYSFFTAVTAIVAAGAGIISVVPTAKSPL